MSNSEVLSVNFNLNGVWRYSPTSGSFNATTSGGFQWEKRDLKTSRITSRNLIPGLRNVDAGTNVQLRQQLGLVKEVGMYLQEEVLLMQDRLLLTAGIRADQNSNDADPSQLFWYPKVAGSYRFIGGSGILDELKIRAAYGQSGNQPLYGQKFTPLTGTRKS